VSPGEAEEWEEEDGADVRARLASEREGRQREEMCRRRPGCLRCWASPGGGRTGPLGLSGWERERRGGGLLLGRMGEKRSCCGGPKEGGERNEPKCFIPFSILFSFTFPVSFCIYIVPMYIHLYVYTFICLRMYVYTPIAIYMYV
jgi:hypothetical protein